MRDAATSPRHPAARLLCSPPPQSRPATRPLLSLPIEVVQEILAEAVDNHPESLAYRKKRSYDPRDHGWRWANTSSLETVRSQAKEYHKGILELMLVCRAFYEYLQPTLLHRPTLTSPKAIIAFAEQTKGHLVKSLVLHPVSFMPTDDMLEAWTSMLPIILPKLTSLEAFVPGMYTMLLSMDSIACALPLANRVTSLDQLDHYAALDISASSGPARSLQNPTLSLIAACPNLRRISLGGINLLENGMGFVSTSGELLGEDEDGEWSASDSVAERFLGVLKLGVAFGADGEEGGLESLLLWENTVLSVSCLHELLQCLPRLRSFHLDCWTYITPSSSATPFYDPGAKLFSLPALAPFFSNLVELSFAPFFSSATRFTGTLDNLLSYAPHLLKLELRSDFVTPLFLRNVLAPGAPQLTYLGFHALPPHTPAYHHSDGTKGQAVHVLIFPSRREIVDLAERAKEVFSAEVEWPEGAQEEGRDASAQGGWYDLLMRLSVIAVRCRAKAEDIWEW